MLRPLMTRNNRFLGCCIKSAICIRSLSQDVCIMVLWCSMHCSLLELLANFDQLICLANTTHYAITCSIRCPVKNPWEVVKYFKDKKRKSRNMSTYCIDSSSPCTLQGIRRNSWQLDLCKCPCSCMGPFRIH